MIITISGHSNFIAEQGDETRLLTLFEELSNGVKVDFYLGGYGNFDCFAFRCAKKFKEYHSNARVLFITPYLNKWLDNRKEFLKNGYDEIIYPAIENVPPKYAILKRNEWMVDKADFVVSYVSTHYGGAYKTLRYAIRRNKPYVNLYNGKFEIL